MTSPGFLSRAALLTTCLALPGFGVTPSEVWNRWKANRANPVNDADDMPDFSYAGYRRGTEAVPRVEGPVFSVKDYGALPGDDLDDGPGIQKAIDAAEKAGGGVVFLPKGNYRLWTDRARTEPLRVRSSKIVIRGEGSTEGGTVLHFVHHGLVPGDYKVPKAGADFAALRFLLQVEAPAEDSKAPSVDLSADAAKGAFRVAVKNASSFRPGQWVLLAQKSKAQLPELLAGQKLATTWGRIAAEGLSLMELHQIEAIDGDVLVFREPLQFRVNLDEKPTVTLQRMIEEVGIEDVAFRGNWNGRFFHHQTGLDDEGWDAVLWERVANGWIRRCSFLNVNTSVYLRRSAFSSLLLNRIDGTPGHYSITLRSESRGVLSGLTEDRSGSCHGPSVGNRSSGIVYWRWKIRETESLDSHANQPLTTLFDRIDGGTFMKCGGPEAAFPHHLKGLVIWNFVYKGIEKMPLDFWSYTKGEGSKFVRPWIVGMAGKEVSFVESSVMVNESPGAFVDPESLFEAQLAFRLGTAPAWVEAEKKAWDSYRKTPLPAVSRRGEWLASDRSGIFRSRFTTGELLEDLAKWFSSFEKSKPGALKIEGDSLPVENDWTLLTRLLQDAVFSSTGGRSSSVIAVSKSDGKVRLSVIASEPGEEKIKIPAEYVGPEVKSEAGRLAAHLGIEVKERVNGWDLILP